MADRCHYCGRPEEDMRPYGPGGAWTCYECARKPENLPETQRQFAAQFDAAAEAGRGVIVLGETTGPRPKFPRRRNH